MVRTPNEPLFIFVGLYIVSWWSMSRKTYGPKRIEGRGRLAAEPKKKFLPEWIFPCLSRPVIPPTTPRSPSSPTRVAASTGKITGPVKRRAAQPCTLDLEPRTRSVVVWTGRDGGGRAARQASKKTAARATLPAVFFCNAIADHRGPAGCRGILAVEKAG